MPHAFVSALVATAVLAVTPPAGAETYQFVGPDGTVHFTSAPNDPHDRRRPEVSGTTAGWLRVPPTTMATPSLMEMIRRAAARHGVPEQLIAAVIRVESGFKANAVSRKGARGLMQLMPGTAAMLGVRNSFDPVENIDGGVRHLRGLLDRFGHDLPQVLVAYNAGEGAVNTYGGIPPYAETQSYVDRILSILGGDVPVSLPTRTFRYVSDEGAVVYTNIPPHGIRARRERALEAIVPDSR